MIWLLQLTCVDEGTYLQSAEGVRFVLYSATAERDIYPGVLGIGRPVVRSLTTVPRSKSLQ